MSAPERLSARGGAVSLWQMLEINGQAFLTAVMEMKRLATVIDTFPDSDRQVPLHEDVRGKAAADADALIGAVAQLHARAAWISAQRLKDRIENDPAFRVVDLRDSMADIESRLRDELSLVNLFVLDPSQSVYLLPGPQLLGQEVADRFPSVLFEMEEAAKCLALSRATASAFHSMRALEVALRALARFLGIPDPTKATDRSWGNTLKTVKERIDEVYPAKQRLPNTEGTKIEGIYATFDAVKNPWRNATMHAEVVYQPYEAAHIIQCVNRFIVDMAAVMDENGDKVTP